VDKRVPGPHVMSGPVYEGVESSHRCNIVPPKPDGTHQMSGPIYPVNTTHKYAGEGSDPKTEVPNPMAGPVFNILHEHHYREVTWGFHLQSKLLIGITDQIYSLSGTKTLFLCSLLAYCYRTVNVISCTMSESDHIKPLPLYCKLVKMKQKVFLYWELLSKMPQRVKKVFVVQKLVVFKWSSKK